MTDKFARVDPDTKNMPSLRSLAAKINGAVEKLPAQERRGIPRVSPKGIFSIASNFLRAEFKFPDKRDRAFKAKTKTIPKRRRAAKRFLKTKKLHHYIWSDEKSWNLGNILAAAPRKQLHIPGRAKPQSWKLKTSGIMVWGAIGRSLPNFRAPLHKMEPETSERTGKKHGVNATTLKHHIEKHLFPYLPADKRKSWLMHDNCLSSSEEFAKWMEEVGTKHRLKPVKNWPPYSPDLNPIENMWNLVTQEAMKTCHGNMRGHRKC